MTSCCLPMAPELGLPSLGIGSVTAMDDLWTACGRGLLMAALSDWTMALQMVPWSVPPLAKKRDRRKVARLVTACDGCSHPARFRIFQQSRWQ